MNQDNDVQAAIVSELLIGTMHSGTHIDALSHMTCGTSSRWYGGHEADVSHFTSSAEPIL